MNDEKYAEILQRAIPKKRVSKERANKNLNKIRKLSKKKNRKK